MDPFRPPQPDEMPGQPWAPGPGSLRDLVIGQYRALAEIEAKLNATWRGRILLRASHVWVRLRRLFRPF